MLPRSILAAFVAALALSQAARADTVVVAAYDSGWYDSTGFHSPTNTNYVVGSQFGSVWRNFFAFDLSGVSGTITGATLTLNTFDVSTGDAFETYTLFDVSTSPTVLTGGTGGIAAYNDLGSGTSFGSRNYTNADDGTTRTISLNGNFLAAANAALGGQFAFGGAVTTLDALSNDEYIYGFSSGPGQLLTLTIDQSTPVAAPLPAVAWGGTSLFGLLSAQRLLRRRSLGRGLAAAD